MGKKFSLDIPFLSGMYKGILSIIVGLFILMPLGGEIGKRSQTKTAVEG